MKIFKVTIDCWYQPPNKKAAPKRVRKSYMLEAADRHVAKESALSLADGKADCSKNWLSFDFVESSTVQFPMEVKP